MSRGGGQGGALAPPLESELSSICIGFSLINDVRARGWPPLERVPPPGKFSGYTHDYIVVIISSIDPTAITTKADQYKKMYSRLVFDRVLQIIFYSSDLLLYA